MISGVVRDDHQTIAKGVVDDQLKADVVKRMRDRETNLEMSLQDVESARCKPVSLWTCDSPFSQIADHFAPTTALAPVGVQGDYHLA
jgi:hypothetical protein